MKDKEVNKRAYEYALRFRFSEAEMVDYLAGGFLAGHASRDEEVAALEGALEEIEALQPLRERERREIARNALEKHRSKT